MKDYYYILGIDRKATEFQIKTAYRKLAKKLHPDTNDGDSFFVERFQDIQEAFEVLSDTSMRQSYDMKLNNHKSSVNDSNNFKKYEEELKRKYEEELRKKEEEIKRKYQTPQQRAEEEAARIKQEIEKLKRAKEQQLLNDIEKNNKLITEKEILYKDLLKRTENVKNEIENLKVQVGKLKTILTGTKEQPINEKKVNDAERNKNAKDKTWNQGFKYI